MKPARYFSVEVTKMGFLAQFNDPKVRVISALVLSLLVAYRIPFPYEKTLDLLRMPSSFISVFILKMIIAIIAMILIVFIPAIKIYGIPLYKVTFNAFMFNFFWPFKYFKKVEIKELLETDFRFIESNNNFYDIATKAKLIRIYKISPVEYSSLSEEEKHKLEANSSNLFNSYTNNEVNQVITVKRVASKTDFEKNVFDKVEILKPILEKNTNDNLKIVFEAYKNNVSNFDIYAHKTPKIDNYFITSESFNFTSFLLALKKITSPKSITLKELKRAKDVLDSRELQTISNLQKQGHRVERIEPEEMKEVILRLLSLH